MSFAFSPGPFWAAWTNFHAQEPSWRIYKSYLPYLCLIFSTQCLILALIVQYFGQINPQLLLPAYFIGSAFIIRMAIKSLNATIKESHFEFGFKQMFILTFVNPKVYIAVPLGALSANYFQDQIVLNAVIFSFALLIPINFAGSLLYALIGKASAKISIQKIRYLTSGLLLFYGLYLGYEGITLLIKS